MTPDAPSVDEQHHDNGQLYIGVRFMFDCALCVAERARGFEGVRWFYFSTYNGIGLGLGATALGVEVWLPFLIFGVNREVSA